MAEAPTTRFGISGWGERPAGSFAGKAVASVIVITAPDAAWDGEGMIPWFSVKNDSDSTKTIQVAALSGQLLDGASTVNLTTARGFALWVADGIGVTASAKWLRVI